MISLMAATMAVQAGLIYQVQNETTIAHSAGIAAAAMLFVFQGAFTIGFQATVWVYPYVCGIVKHGLRLTNGKLALRFFPCGFAKRDRQFLRLQTGSSIM